jgi:molybdopterin converting factor small subunit
MHVKVKIFIPKKYGKYEFEIKREMRIIDLIEKINVYNKNIKKTILKDNEINDDYLILINGKRAKLESKIKNNDVISFLPIISGG